MTFRADSEEAQKKAVVNKSTDVTRISPGLSIALSTRMLPSNSLTAIMEGGRGAEVEDRSLKECGGVKT